MIKGHSYSMQFITYNNKERKYDLGTKQGFKWYSTFVFSYF